MATTPCCVLVDDDPDFLSFTRECLARVSRDFHVVEFLNGYEALDFVARNRTDLVITDFKMPHFNGLDLTTAIRAFEPSVPIVIISGDEIGDEALACGASAFLPKRLLMSELAPTLERVGIFTAM